MAFKIKRIHIMKLRELKLNEKPTDKAKEHFKKIWGTAFIGATLRTDKGILELSMEDIYKTMQSFKDEG